MTLASYGSYFLVVLLLPYQFLKMLLKMIFGLGPLRHKDLKFLLVDMLG